MVERRLGRLLLQMRAGGLFRDLGFVRLGDYVGERLGLGYRTAQELMRVEETLARLPVAAAAFDRGRITSGHVRALTRVATPDNESSWVELAQRSSAREFTWKVSRAVDGPGPRGREEPTDDQPPPVERLGIVVPAWMASLWRETVTHIRWLVGQFVPSGPCLEFVLAEQVVSSPEAEEPPETVGPPEAVGQPDAVAPAKAVSPPGENASTGSRACGPAGAAGARREVRGAGNEGDCPRFIEGSAGFPDGGSEAGASEAPLPVGIAGIKDACVRLGEGGAGSPDRGSDAAALGRTGTEPAASKVDRVAGAGSGRVARPGPAPGLERTRGEGVAGAGAAGDSPRDVDVRAIDRELRRLITERQRQEAELASLLRSAAAERAYRLLGFRSLEEYGRERFGLSSRQTYYLLALERSLESLPAVRAAFLAGRVTLRKALLVAGVATCSTEALWIDRAVNVTLRRLEDEVTYWRHLRETRPEVWSLLHGRPLPEDLALVPGQPPRLRQSNEARWTCAAGACCFEVRVGAGLHGSALRTRAPFSGGEACACGSPARVGAGLHGSAPFVTTSGESVGPMEGSSVGEAAHAERPCGHPCRARPLAGSNRAFPVSAAQFLKALNDAEAAVPLPSRVCHLQMNVEPDVMKMWRDRVRHLRATVREDLAEWEVLALALRDFWRTWDNPETRRQRRGNRTLERDGWRCTAPGCRSIGTGRLHEHHIVFRSAGGPLSDASNLTTLCTGHHLGLLHRERMRCKGQAPDRLTWEMGIQPGKAPFLLFENERLIAGAS